MKPEGVLIAFGVAALAYSVWKMAEQARETAANAQKTLIKAADAVDVLGVYSGGASNTGALGAIAEGIGYAGSVLDNAEVFAERGKHAFLDAIGVE